jgi:hypothetical protein
MAIWWNFAKNKSKNLFFLGSTDRNSPKTQQKGCFMHDAKRTLGYKISPELLLIYLSNSWDDVSQQVIAWMHIDIARVNWFSTYRVHHRVADQFHKGRAFGLRADRSTCTATHHGMRRSPCPMVEVIVVLVGAGCELGRGARARQWQAQCRAAHHRD